MDKTWRRYWPEPRGVGDFVRSPASSSDSKKVIRGVTCGVQSVQTMAVYDVGRRCRLLAGAGADKGPTIIRAAAKRSVYKLSGALLFCTIILQ